MIGIIIVAHGPLAKAFYETTLTILGPDANLLAISIGANDNSDTAREKVKEAIRQMDSGNGVLILTDLFGGSPSNMSLAFLEENKVEVISGLNLPMVIKLVQLQESLSLKEAANVAKEAGQKSIWIASDFLSKGHFGEEVKRGVNVSEKDNIRKGS